MPVSAHPHRAPRLALRLIVIAVVLGASIWGGRLAWQKLSPSLMGSKRQEKIPTSKARPATISEEIVAVGRLRAVFSTELRSEINGRIVKILGVDGQKVERNQEILRLDQQDLLTQIQEVDRTIEAARLKAQRARRDYERLLNLQQNGVVTTKDLEDARVASSLGENDAAIAEARAANLRDKLSKTVIRAAHNGTLLLRDLTEGQVITGAAAQNGGMLLGEVADLSVLMVRTNINEIDVARLKVGDPARVRVDSIRSMIIAGTIKRISTSASESSVDRTRVFPVDVVLDEADERLRPGMSATVIVTLARAEDALALPLSGVFSTADSARYVFLLKGERFEIREVETGIADTRRVQILSGLESGDEVALTRPLVFEGDVPSGVMPAAVTKSKSAKRDAEAAAPNAPPAADSPGRSRSN